MSKSEALKVYRKNTDAIPYPIDRVLFAIIDALPEEPRREGPPLKGACAECGNLYGKAGDICQRCGHIFVPAVGPEPKDERTTQPTSAREWWICLKPGKRYGFSSEQDARAWASLTGRTAICVVPKSESTPDPVSQPTSACIPPEEARGYMDTALSQADRCEAQNERMIELLRKIYERIPALGQRSEPPATSAAQPPEATADDYLCALDDARKLRIMKAMEDHCAKHKDATFSCYYGDQWALITKGPPSCANFDFWKTQAEIDVAYEESERKIRARKEEQRIDKEIAEVKEEATKVSTCEPCNRFFIDECPTCGKKPGFSYLSEERQLRTALGVARAEGQIMEREYARVTKLLGRCEDVLGECAHFICGVGREDVAKRIHVFLESVMPGAMVKKGPIL